MFVVLFCTLFCWLQAESVDAAVSAITARIGKVLVAKGKPKLAVLDFTDIEGRPTEYGRFLAEQLSVEFVNTPGISVVDRANLKSILAEHKLSEDGLIKPDTAKKLGQFAGVDVIVIGTLTQMDDGFALTVKAIATDTAEIVAASKALISKTRETQQLGARVVGGKSASTTRVRDANETPALATKDFGDLRVSLKVVRRTMTKGTWSQISAVECAFDFTNLNLKKPMLCAGNGEMGHSYTLRARLTTPTGEILNPADVRGLPSVCVYGYGVSPSLIAESIRSGTHIDRGRAYYPNERLWQGNFTKIPPGDTLPISVVFSTDPRRGEAKIQFEDLHLDFEFVVAQEGRDGQGGLPAAARLHVLSLDGLSVER